MNEETSRNLIAKLEKTWTSAEDELRRQKAALRVLVRSGGAIAAELVKPFPYEGAAEFASRGKFVVNILGLIVKVLNFLYDVPPGRVLKNEQERADWERILWKFSYGLDATNAAALGYAKLLGSCIAYPCYLPYSEYQPDDPTGDGSEDGVVYNLTTPDRACVVTSPYDPSVAWAVAIQLGKIENILPDGGVQRGTLFNVWTRSHSGHMLALENGGWINLPTKGVDKRVLELHEHGLKIFPVLALRREIDPARTDFWGAGIGGDDLMESLSALYTAWSAYVWCSELQRGQPYSSGGKVTGALSPVVVVETEPGSTFGIVPNGANLAGQKECLLACLEALGKTLGLPSRTFRLDDTSAQSGLAIALDRGELEDERRSDEKTWEVHEKLMHKLAAEIYKAGRQLLNLSPVQLSALLAMEYKAHVVPLTSADVREGVRLQRSEGSMSRLEMKMQLQPNLDLSQAEKLLVLADAEAAAGRAKLKEEEQVNKELDFQLALDQKTREKELEDKADEKEELMEQKAEALEGPEVVVINSSEKSNPIV
jgi:hypothetical protein